MNARRPTHLLAAIPLALFLAAAAFAQKPELVVQAGHASPVTAVAFSPDGRLIASGSGTGGFSEDVNVVKLWDALGGAELRTLAPDGAPGWIAFSADGARVAVAGGKTVKVWDVRTGAELRNVRPDSGYVTRAASPDGRLVAEHRLFSEEANVVRLRDASTGALRHTLTHEGGVHRAEFTPDGRKLRAGLPYGKVKVWDAATGAELPAGEGEDFDYVARAVSFDGKAVAQGDGKSVR